MIGGIKIMPWRQCNAVSPAVTATQTGSGTHNGMVLTVEVVTGANIMVSGPQYQSYFSPGTTASASAYTPAQIAITPQGTGSWVYGAVNRTDAATSWTAMAGSTFTQNVADATNSAAYGTFRSTGTTTAGTPITTGATNGDGVSGGGVAVAEIPASEHAGRARVEPGRRIHRLGDVGDHRAFHPADGVAADRPGRYRRLQRDRVRVPTTTAL